MPRILQAVSMAFLAGMLNGCGPALERWEGVHSFMVAAKPLCEEVPGYQINADGTCAGISAIGREPPGAHQPNGKPLHAEKEYLGTVVNESEYLCADFVNRLVLASNSTNTGLDLLTTVFSALGTALTPLATVHALTASSSISSGWKTAIDSDIYARATIANYAQAIESTYYSDIKAYVDKLTTAADDDLVESIEVSKIRTIHKECSLASAQAAISASLQPSAPAAVSSSQVVTVTSAAAGDKFDLAGESSTLRGPLDVQYAAVGSDNAPAVAGKLVGLINGSAEFQAAGVTATLQSVSGATFILHSPAAINWTVRSGRMALGGGTGPASPASVTNGSATSGAVPGHSVR